MKPSATAVIIGFASVIVVAAIGVGFYLTGSPAEERARRTDNRRVSDLRRIAAATDLYWTRHMALPQSLDVLAAEPGVTIDTLDPVSLETYAYQPLDSIRYEVCATFELETSDTWRQPTRNLWAHGSGPQCFQLDAEEISERQPRSPDRLLVPNARALTDSASTPPSGRTDMR